MTSKLYYYFGKLNKIRLQYAFYRADRLEPAFNQIVCDLDTNNAGNIHNILTLNITMIAFIQSKLYTI